jgi:hypothetical protein
MRKSGFSNLSCFFLLFIFALSLPSLAAESGWFRMRKFFKPFVKVENYVNKQVIFVTKDGKIYSGRCQEERRLFNSCYIVPNKKFAAVDGGITYIVLKVDGYYPPKVIEYGAVDNFNVIHSILTVGINHSQ